MFKDLVINNRSYRGFDQTRKVTESELLEMVDCARLTASSSNTQPLKYYIAHEDIIVKKIQSCTKWAKKLSNIELPHEGKEPTAFIIICHDKSITTAADYFRIDVGIAAQTILLSAVESGLGGCMIANFNADDLIDAIKLPEKYKPMLVIAIGKPDETVILKEAESDAPVDYYRDGSDTHYVPKRALKDIVLSL